MHELMGDLHRKPPIGVASSRTARLAALCGPLCRGLNESSELLRFIAG